MDERLLLAALLVDAPLDEDHSTNPPRQANLFFTLQPVEHAAKLHDVVIGELDVALPRCQSCENVCCMRLVHHRACTFEELPYRHGVLMIGAVGWVGYSDDPEPRAKARVRLSHAHENAVAVGVRAHTGSVSEK